MFWLKREDLRIETVIRNEGRCYATDYEEGRKDHKLRNAYGLKAGKD